MRFRLKNNQIHLYLSDREVERYQSGLKKENVIGGIKDFELQEGQHTVKINNIEVQVDVKIQEERVGYKAVVTSGNHKFSFHKIKPITKYDLFRNLVANLRFIV